MTMPSHTHNKGDKSACLETNALRRFRYATRSLIVSLSEGTGRFFPSGYGDVANDGVPNG